VVARDGARLVDASAAPVPSPPVAEEEATEEARVERRVETGMREGDEEGWRELERAMVCLARVECAEV
jgi:hypothetical protein